MTVSEGDTTINLPVRGGKTISIQATTSIASGDRVVLLPTGKGKSVAVAPTAISPGDKVVMLPTRGKPLAFASGGASVKNTPWSKRVYLASAVLPSGTVAISGGRIAGGAPVNDVWRTANDGATWGKMVENAGWSARFVHEMVALPNGNLVVIAGVDRSDVWVSTDQGATWSRQTASIPQGNLYGFCAGVRSEGSIIIAGGMGSTELNSVYRSIDDGQTWALRTASAEWSPRRHAAMTVMPDNSLILYGGIDEYGSVSREVWKSTDAGEKWTQVSSTAPPLAYHRMEAFSDGSLVAVGGYNGSDYINTVYASYDSGANWSAIGSAGNVSLHGHRVAKLSSQRLLLIAGQWSYDDEVTVPSKKVWQSSDRGVSWSLLSK